MHLCVNNNSTKPTSTGINYPSNTWHQTSSNQQLAIVVMYVEKCCPRSWRWKDTKNSNICNRLITQFVVYATKCSVLWTVWTTTRASTTVGRRRTSNFNLTSPAEKDRIQNLVSIFWRIVDPGILVKCIDLTINANDKSGRTDFLVVLCVRIMNARSRDSEYSLWTCHLKHFFQNSLMFSIWDYSIF